MYKSIIYILLHICGKFLLKEWQLLLSMWGFFYCHTTLCCFWHMPFFTDLSYPSELNPEIIQILEWPISDDLPTFAWFAYHVFWKSRINPSKSYTCNWGQFSMRIYIYIYISLSLSASLGDQSKSCLTGTSKHWMVSTGKTMYINHQQRGTQIYI